MRVAQELGDSKAEGDCQRIINRHDGSVDTPYLSIRPQQAIALDLQSKLRLYSSAMNKCSSSAQFGWSPSTLLSRQDARPPPSSPSDLYNRRIREK